jgi:hypothetical protein
MNELGRILMKVAIACFNVKMQKYPEVTNEKQQNY